MPTRYGASYAEWDHFTYVLGLTPHLLTVVSNPHAELSPDSGMGSIGKTPSRYNQQGKVVGIPGWTRVTWTEHDSERASHNPDLGICVQTRGDVRAIDVDVDDQALADAIRSEIVDFLGFTPPCRSRPNSAKFLFAVAIEGEYSKRIIRTAATTGDVDKNGNPKRHIIEFLATGQQFIAAGTHPSGVRYEWLPSLPLGFPTIPADVFEALWTHLFIVFGHSETRSATETRDAIPRLSSDATPDALAEHIVASGVALNVDARSGRIDFKCPFSDGHTSSSGPSETSYFPAGTGGYAQGHVKCQHASCAHRTTAEFAEALGFTPVLDMFDELPMADGGVLGGTAGAAAAPLQDANEPEFRRNEKGAIVPTRESVAAALGSPKFCGHRVAFDDFNDEIMIAPEGTNEWRRYEDEDAFTLCLMCERKQFAHISDEVLRASVRWVARRNRFDSAILWARSLPPWDGVKRIDGFFTTYFGVEDTEFAEACSAYLWTALAGRVVQPGVKVDMVPILCGPQGIKKSTSVKAIAPSEETFAELSLAERDDDLSRRMRGCIVAELAELRGLTTRELEAIKAVITRTHEDWIPKYKEFRTTFPRRLVFIGTTNQQEFLYDPTGNRRFLPLTVRHGDPEGIARDRAQLWAEAIQRFDENVAAGRDGVEWRAADSLSAARHGEYRISDAWETAVVEWLHAPDMAIGFEAATEHTANQTAQTPADRPYLRMRDVLAGAIRLRDGDIDRKAELRMAAVLRTLGYERSRLREPGARPCVWVKCSAIPDVD